MWKYDGVNAPSMVADIQLTIHRFTVLIELYLPTTELTEVNLEVDGVNAPINNASPFSIMNSISMQTRNLRIVLMGLIPQVLLLIFLLEFKKNRVQ